MIDESAIKGEHDTGFERRGSKGPFECGNCHYYRNGGCYEKNMVKYSNQPKLADGGRGVRSEDCCEYIDRPHKRTILGG